MKYAILLLTPVLLCAESPDRVSELLERMRKLTLTGNQAAVGEIVPLLVGALARPHPEAGLAWNQVGVYYATNGNFAEAERAYRLGIKSVEHAATRVSDLAVLLLNLGELYVQTGERPGQAEVLLRRALDLATKSFGPAAPELANFLNVLGMARLQRGDSREARELLERAVTFLDESREGKIRRGMVLANLAVLFQHNRQWTEVRDTMLQAVHLMEQNVSAGHPDLVAAYINLSAVHGRFKQWDLAAASLDKARMIVETRLSPEHPWLPVILNSQAHVLKKLGRGTEARELSRRARALSGSQNRDLQADSWIHVSDLKK